MRRHDDRPPISEHAVAETVTLVRCACGELFEATTEASALTRWHEHATEAER